LLVHILLIEVEETKLYAYFLEHVLDDEVLASLWLEVQGGVDGVTEINQSLGLASIVPSRGVVVGYLALY